MSANTRADRLVYDLALAWCTSVGTTVKEMLTPDGDFLSFAEFVIAVCRDADIQSVGKAAFRDGLWAAQCHQEQAERKDAP